MTHGMGVFEAHESIPEAKQAGPTLVFQRQKGSSEVKREEEVSADGASLAIYGDRNN